MSKSKGAALVLAGIPGLGLFGFDKLYVGAIGLFLAQFFCTLFVIGILFSGPYAFISTLTLVLTILFGINTFLYPKVNWSPTTKSDKIIAWIVVALHALGLLVIIVNPLFSRSEGFQLTQLDERTHEITWVM